MTAQQANNVFKFNISKKIDKDVLDVISKECKDDNGTYIIFEPVYLDKYKRIERQLEYLGYQTKIEETYTSLSNRSWWHKPTMYQLYISWGHA